VVFPAFSSIFSGTRRFSGWPITPPPESQKNTQLGATEGGCLTNGLSVGAEKNKHVCIYFAQPKI